MDSFFLIKGFLHVLYSRAIDLGPKAAFGKEDYALWRHFLISYPMIEWKANMKLGNCSY